MNKVFSTILVIIWAMLIFTFSAQPASQSSDLSEGVTYKVVSFAMSLSDNSSLDIDEIVNMLEKTIRKLAHFTEYAILGFFTCIMFYSYGLRQRKIYFHTIILCFLYAVSDEIHQFFVPGRATRLIDVIIDICGVFFSVLLCRFIKYFVNLHNYNFKNLCKTNNQRKM